jgi:hypothetical protein
MEHVMKSFTIIVSTLLCTYACYTSARDYEVDYSNDFENPILNTFLVLDAKPKAEFFIHTDTTQSRADAIEDINTKVAQFIKKKNSTLGIRNKDVDSIAQKINILTSELSRTIKTFINNDAQAVTDADADQNFTVILKTLGKLRQTYASENSRITKLMNSIFTTNSSKELLRLIQKVTTSAISFIEKFAYLLDHESAYVQRLRNKNYSDSL